MQHAPLDRNRRFHFSYRYIVLFEQTLPNAARPENRYKTFARQLVLLLLLLLLLLQLLLLLSMQMPGTLLTRGRGSCLAAAHLLTGRAKLVAKKTRCHGFVRLMMAASRSEVKLPVEEGADGADVLRQYAEAALIFFYFSGTIRVHALL